MDRLPYRSRQRDRSVQRIVCAMRWRQYALLIAGVLSCAVTQLLAQSDADRAMFDSAVKVARARARASPNASDQALRRELLRRQELGQAARDEKTIRRLTTGRHTSADSAAYFERMQRTDRENAQWLDRLIRERGFPRSEVVGYDGVASAFLIVQHAVLDTALMTRTVPLIERAHERGDLDGQDLALLTDRILQLRGVKQRFGTQMSLVNGTLVVDPIEDSAGVDIRRRSMGLPPLELAMQILNAPPERPVRRSRGARRSPNSRSR